MPWSPLPLIRALIPSWGPTLVASSKPSHLPGAAPLLPSHWEFGLRHLNLEDTVQLVAQCQLQRDTGCSAAPCRGDTGGHGEGRLPQAELWVEREVAQGRIYTNTWAVVNGLMSCSEDWEETD